MATIIAGKGALTAAGDTTVDSTAQLRYVRVRVYNRDTVQHKYTLKIASQAVDEVTLQAGESRTFGPHAVAAADAYVVNTAEATTTTASAYAVTGEY